MLDIMEILMGHSTLPICFTWFDVAGPQQCDEPQSSEVFDHPQPFIGCKNPQVYHWVKHRTCLACAHLGMGQNPGT